MKQTLKEFADIWVQGNTCDLTKESFGDIVKRCVDSYEQLPETPSRKSLKWEDVKKEYESKQAYSITLDYPIHVSLQGKIKAYAQWQIIAFSANEGKEIDWNELDMSPNKVSFYMIIQIIF